MNISTVKWAQWDKTQSRELLGLFICVCIALCTIVAHNIARNRHDNFPSYPLDNHHCSDDVYLREGGHQTRNKQLLIITLHRTNTNHSTITFSLVLHKFLARHCSRDTPGWRTFGPSEAGCLLVARNQPYTIILSWSSNGLMRRRRCTLYTGSPMMPIPWCC